MNWKRIASGALLAGLVVFLADFLIHHILLGSTWQMLQQEGRTLSPKPYTFPLILIQEFSVGFILMWLYALARPRLGPGPSTALVMGSFAWFLLSVPANLTLWLWFPLPGKIPQIALLGDLLKCWAGIYVAGWQYLEKAP